MKHELMHVFEGLLVGGSDANLVDAWFIEGVAEVVSGGTAGGSVTDFADFEGLVEEFGECGPF